MTQAYGEAFKKPVDVFTGKPMQDAPLVAIMPSNGPNGNGVVMIRDTDMQAAQANGSMPNAKRS